MACFTQDISAAFTAYPSDLSPAIQRCFGSDNDKDITVDFWASGVCPSLIRDYLYDDGLGVITDVINHNHYLNLQIASWILLSRYYTGLPNGPTPVFPGQLGYHPIQTVIADLCSSRVIDGIEGICTDVLTKLCNGCSREQISNNLPYTRLCGCFAPDFQAPDGAISKQCDSLCDQPKYVASLRSKVDPYPPIVCDSRNICVITDVNLLANGTEFDGTFNLKQKCSGCTSTSPCRCVIDSTLPDQIKRLGFANAAQFDSVCDSANSLCVVRDPATGIIRNVDCKTQLFPITEDGVSSASESRFLNVPRPLWYIFMVVAVITCIIAIGIAIALS